MLPTLVRELGAPARPPWAVTRPDPRWAARPRPQTPLWRREPTAHGGSSAPRRLLSASLPLTERTLGRWTGSPGATQWGLSLFYDVGGCRPRGPSARRAWGPGGVLSPGGWLQVADCPPHTLSRLLRGHRGAARPASLGLRAGEAPRPEARLQAGHATRQMSVLGPGGRRLRAGAPQLRGGPCLPPPAPRARPRPHALHLPCLCPSLPEDTGHWVRSAPSQLILSTKTVPQYHPVPRFWRHHSARHVGDR